LTDKDVDSIVLSSRPRRLTVPFVVVASRDRVPTPVHLISTPNNYLPAVAYRLHQSRTTRSPGLARSIGLDACGLSGSSEDDLQRASGERRPMSSIGAEIEPQDGEVLRSDASLLAMAVPGFSRSTVRFPLFFPSPSHANVLVFQTQVAGVRPHPVVSTESSLSTNTMSESIKHHSMQSPSAGPSLVLQLAR